MTHPRAVIDQRVGVTALPTSTIQVGSLTTVDYGDSFTVSTTVAASPEQWARALFGDVPNVAQVFAWETVLGFRLNRDPSPFTVAGWTIGGYADKQEPAQKKQPTDWIRLEQRSRLITANLIVDVTESHLRVTTLVGHVSRLGRTVWGPLSHVHRRLLASMMMSANQAILNAGRPYRDWPPAPTQNPDL